jgi:hypothetical protein
LSKCFCSTKKKKKKLEIQKRIEKYITVGKILNILIKIHRLVFLPSRILESLEVWKQSFGVVNIETTFKYFCLLFTLF